MMISVSQAWEVGVGVGENAKDMKLQRKQNLRLRSGLPQLGSERQTRKAVCRAPRNGAERDSFTLVIAWRGQLPQPCKHTSPTKHAIKMARKAAVELSDYEKQRQANIAERDALLKQLALDAASVGLAPKAASKPKSSANSAPKKKLAVKKVKEEVLPKRTSSRLAGLTADSEVAKRKAEDEYVAAQEAARAKRQRVSGDLNLSDIVVAGKQWDVSENFLVDVVARGAKPYERTFGETEVKQTTDKELRALREKMSGLELYEGFEPNSTDTRLSNKPDRY